jgi:ABC-type spermidine/putrescine transport system permease subunit II
MLLQVNPTLAAVSTMLVVGIAIVVLLLASFRRDRLS